MNGQSCEILGCAKPARWKTWRADKSNYKWLCDAHFADKVGKYELNKIEPIKR